LPSRGRRGAEQVAMTPGAAARVAGLLGWLLVGGPASAQRVAPVPAFTAHAVDTTGTFRPDELAQLERNLAAFETRKGSQVAVLIVPTTEPEEIEQYSIRVVEQWKVGRKKVDDGVLLLVAKNDRALRIEVGYGLEGAIPDAIAKRIVADVITPRFRAGDFAGGVNAGVDALMKVIDGEPLPAPERDWHGSRQRAAPFQTVLLGSWLLAAFIGATLRGRIGRLPSALAAGTGAGLFAWFLTSFLGAVLVASVMAFVL